MAEQEEIAANASEALAQLQYVQNIYTQRYELLNSQLTAMNIARESMLRGLELASNTDRMKGTSILLTTDDATYMRARIEDVESIITYVGGGYLTEKPVKDAKAFLEQNMKENDAIHSKLVAEMQNLEKELFSISYRIAALTRQ